jgi:2-oxoglutarate ferredoxin oxidoreductase subunit alpha
MFGYPITPSTEVLTMWIKLAQENKNIHYLQTEDEIAAGFAMAGAVMAGAKTFTATAGPGTVLMQDSFSMADGMRLPMVMIVGQRGGPSSGTVIYSQQEVNLAIKGGNGEGMRIVYSPSTLSELYYVTRKAFNNAWKYRFPAVVLTDGFLLKTKMTVDLADYQIENVPAEPLVSEKTQKNIRNIYTVEEELENVLVEYKKDFDEMAEKVEEFESYKVNKVHKVGELIIAHGIVASAAKEAVDELWMKGEESVAMFRPITLSPFPKKELNELAKRAKRIIIVESSMGQLRDLVKENLEVDIKIDGLYRPAVGIEKEEIIKFLS